MIEQYHATFAGAASGKWGRKRLMAGMSQQSRLPMPHDQRPARWQAASTLAAMRRSRWRQTASQ